MSAHSKYFTVAAAIVGVMAAATLLAFSEDWGAQWRITPSLSINKVHFTVRALTSSWRVDQQPRCAARQLSRILFVDAGFPRPGQIRVRRRCRTIDLRGPFSGGHRVGKLYLRCRPRVCFRAAEQMGYDTPDDEQLFSMLMMDINREFAREIHDSGLRASSQDLIGLKIHGVTLDYIREARQAGYQNLTADDYVQLRIHGVETAFLRDLKAAGYDLRAADIVQLRIHGVDSRYMRDLKSYGLKPEAADLAQMRMHGVTPEYLKGPQGRGLREPARGGDRPAPDARRRAAFRSGSPAPGIRFHSRRTGPVADPRRGRGVPQAVAGRRHAQSERGADRQAPHARRGLFTRRWNTSAAAAARTSAY